LLKHFNLSKQVLWLTLCWLVLPVHHIWFWMEMEEGCRINCGN